MHITFAPRGILQIDDARLTFKNFEGREDKFNRKGDRNFALVVESQEDADRLVEDGWNVKIRPPREEGEEPFMYLPVKIKFNDRGPRVRLRTGDVENRLDEETIGELDYIDILNVDLDIRPYDWEVNGKVGRTAYLQEIYVVQKEDRFAKKYSDDLPY